MSAATNSGMVPTISFGNPVPAVPLEVDPPTHRDYRKLMIAPVHPDRVNAQSPEIRRLINE